MASTHCFLRGELMASSYEVGSLGGEVVSLAVKAQRAPVFTFQNLPGGLLARPERVTYGPASVEVGVLLPLSEPDGLLTPPGADDVVDLMSLDTELSSWEEVSDSSPLSSGTGEIDWRTLDASGTVGRRLGRLSAKSSLLSSSSYSCRPRSKIVRSPVKFLPRSSSS